MARKKKIPLESVLNPNENIYWQGKPEKLAFILSGLKNDASELLLRIIIDLILIPVLFLNSNADFSIIVQVILITLWLFHLKPILDILSKPAKKSIEWKNTYYIITDQNIYIQFGTNNIYYRTYPSDRIGTKVFFRKNKIDSTLLVGTIGFSVDDYYEERLMSIKNYEDAFKVLKTFAAIKKEKIQEEMEAEKARQEELLKQQILLQEAEELQNKENNKENNIDDEYEFESYDDYKKRMQEEEALRIQQQREEELQKEREHEELLNKYNEYRRRHDLQSRQNNNNINNSDNLSEEINNVNISRNPLLNDADDSGIEDGVEIEFPVDNGKNKISRPPKSKKRRNPRKDYKYDVTKNKPEVEYGGVNGKKPEKQKQLPPEDNNSDSSDNLDMSLLWGNINSTD